MGNSAKEATLADYRSAYMQVHGTEPSIIEKPGGWFQVGSSSYRLATLRKMTVTLNERPATSTTSGQEP